MSGLEFAVQLRLALETMGRPSGLAPVLSIIALQADVSLPGDPLEAIAQHVRHAGPNDSALRDLTLSIQRWDHIQEGNWVAETAPDSPERRSLILARLGFGLSQQERINAVVRCLDPQDLAVVIAEDHVAWYEKRRGELPSFYWRHYSDQLLKAGGGWDPDAVSILDGSTTDVVSRLSDPSRQEIKATRGLVMGYVQSGKTAHFTGLIAKAADAGYRLVIVLAGTLDILRRQTQRRLDKDIIGQELLPPGEYSSDSELSSFVRHGGRPSDLGAFDWERLTDRQDDYKSLKRHLSLLAFTPTDRSRRFNDPENLRGAMARLAVIKKNPQRLDQLCDDLERLRELRTALEHVPTLVIDDESDQASVNTIDRQRPGKEDDRTRTNRAIGRLLRLLPRAQYVGYTATPYANVFIDPEDEEDLFPRDYIVSLQRPAGYMGVSDFHDLHEAFAPDDFRGRQNAFVRSVTGDNSDEANLPAAIDSFVLAGALKLYRMHASPQRWRFRHHTMLVHHSAQQHAHAEDKELVAQIFAAGRRYAGRGLQRLGRLYTTDYLPVSAAQAPDLPVPSSFDELVPFISQCVSRVVAGDPVRVVNGDPGFREDTPDFDQEPVWAILVGGTKLSRGYTVEGLTVSYYRRPTGAGDTLLQMGRWFGFRDGYKDLVRLYIGRAEKRGKTVIDLYEAFRAMCDDEEALRRDLEKYRREGLRPRQVPPLVQQYLDVLPPTARNKMFNATIAARDFSGETTEKTMAPVDEKRSAENLTAAAALLARSALGRAHQWELLQEGQRAATVRAHVGTAPGAAVLRFMEEYQWEGGNTSFDLERKFVRERIKAGEFGEWFVMVPQLKGASETIAVGESLPAFKTVERSRVEAGRFKAYRDPEDARLADHLAGDGRISVRGADVPGAPGRPVLAIYFVRTKGEPGAPVAVGFFIRYPGTPRKGAITWSVRDTRNRDAVVVARP